MRRLPPGLPFAVLSNDDVEFHNESLPRLINHLRLDPRVGAVGPRFCDEVGTLWPSTGDFPTALDAVVRSVVFPRPVRAFVRRVDARLQMPRRAARGRLGQFAEADPADWVVGAAMAVRVEAFHEVGGFDEDFFLYFEEADFCYRLWTKGWIVLSSRNVSVVHLRGRSTGSEYLSVFREARRLYLIKRVGRVRWAMLECLYPFILIAGSAMSLGAALATPRTAFRRLQGMRESWSRRVFLLPPFPGTRSSTRAQR
jgi:N-acetylglucosaminyl-diphospho-decaprenol L-rhamnosyltransferase